MVKDHGQDHRKLPGTPCLFQFPRPDVQHVFRHLQGRSGVNTAFVFKAGRSIAAGPARPIFHEPREKERCKPGQALTAEQSGDEGRGALVVWRFEARGYSGVRSGGKTRLKGRRDLVYLWANTESFGTCRSTYWNRLE